MRDHVRFFLNGQPQAVGGPAAFGTLAEHLRERLGLVGTKVVCAEGDCGACTVLVGRPDGGRLHYFPVDACILFLAQLDAAHVVTVEGLSDGGLHPVQRAMVECHGSQCGYCTPGFVMALAGWAEDGADPDPAAVRLALTGNLCRCTGYLPILDAAAAVAGTPPVRLAERPESARICAELAALAAEPLRVEAGGRTFFAPTMLAEAVAFKASGPDVAVVSGATELGVLRNKRGYEPRALLSLARVGGLDAVEHADGRVAIGANVTWARVEREVVPLLPAFGPIVRRFGSPQIRNVATLAGNVVNGSPIADALPLLLVLDAELEIAGPGGVRRRPLGGFYTAYKKADLAPGEVVTRVVLPLPAPGDRLRLYKVSRRNDLDIASFGAAIRVREAGGLIRRAAVAYSGVGPTVLRLPKAESALAGRPFDEATFRQAGRVARSEVAPLSDVRGSKDYRWQLAENVLVKFFFEETAEG
jgi:xanthine dehydrogenase small subunit